MVSAFSLSQVDPNQESTIFKQKSVHRPAPLNLKGSFVNGERERRRAIRALRASTENPTDNKEPTSIPVNMGVSMPGSSHKENVANLADTTVNSSSSTVQHSSRNPEKPDSQAHHKEGTITAKSLGEMIAEVRQISPQGSLRTVLQHDSKSDSDVSSLSGDRPSTRTGAVLARFFPELSTSFRDISPANTYRQTRTEDSPSAFVSELDERIQNFHTNSAFPTNCTEEESTLEQTTSSSPSSDDTFDGASSCYSRRSSVTSIDTEVANEDCPYKSADAYSILNPVAAGVFDDAISLCPSRAPSVAPRLPATQTEDVPRPRPRQNSIVSKASVDEWKNKPLPLEPITEPSPLFVRRPGHAPSPPRSRSSSRRRTSDSKHLGARQPRYPKQSCPECGGHQGHVSRQESRSQWHEHTNGQRLRYVPTLSQAAQELEYALADLAKDPKLKQRTLLVLDGPLQISRHNGDLIATRPAPSPPSSGTQTHRSTSREALRFGKDKPRQPSKAASTPDETSRGLGYLRSLHKSSMKQKSGDTSENVLDPRHTKSSSSDSKKALVKSKKALNLFGRKDDRWANLLSTTRSENSLDPQEQGSGGRGLSPSQSSSWDSTPSTLSKRDDLLLQLPRLQTQDLELNKIFDSFNNIEGLAKTPKSPTHLPAGASDGDEQEHPSPKMRSMPPHEEKIPVENVKTRQSRALVSTAQASSVQIPPDQVFELTAEPLSPTSTVINCDVLMNLSFPMDMPEDVIVSILKKIGSLDDLFNFALVNKRFYAIFKKRELSLIKNALYKMSPPAWELREMSPPWPNESNFLPDPDSRVPEYTATSYLDKYAQDIYTLARLKSMILVRCSPFLRRETLRGLSGVDHVRAEEVDHAFWRVWTFCRIFGSGKGRETDLEGQMDWLKGGVKARSISVASPSMTEPFGMNNVLFEPPEGFAMGNRGGLSQKQMYDMTEIWTCLAVLLQGMHGKCKEARDVGIFDGMTLQTGDTTQEETALGKNHACRQLTFANTSTEEWTSYVLTLGLSAVLALSSLCPAEATAETFEKAKETGLTKWEQTETGTTRSSFLKEAISRVYEEQERALNSQTNSPKDQASRESELANAEAERARERHKAFKLELRARRLREANSDQDIGTSFAKERPMSEFSTIVHNLNGSIRQHPSTRTTTTASTPPPPVPPIPSLVIDRCSSPTSSIASRTPNFMQDPTARHSDPSIPLPNSHPFNPAFAPPPLRPQVQDPVDRAITRMVHDLGFDENDVKWALKITDTGEGIDVRAAEDLLKQEKRKNQYNPFAPRGRGSLLESVIKRQGSQDSGWRWA